MLMVRDKDVLRKVASETRLLAERTYRPLRCNSHRRRIALRRLCRTIKRVARWMIQNVPEERWPAKIQEKLFGL